MTLKRTSLYAKHRGLNAKMTDFNGWEMPLYYTSILEEHQLVREKLGIFDTSHMGQFVVEGADAQSFLNRILVSDLSQVGVGRACYSLMLNEKGGILDDLIAYRLGEQVFLVVVNCATKEKDWHWMNRQIDGDVTLKDISEGRSLLAVQGPGADRVLEQLLDTKVSGLGRFCVAPIRTMGSMSCIARTGYTGGDGFELFLPDKDAVRLWDMILATNSASGVVPAGLGARDTLRLEAGLRLYGNDMNEETTPFEAGLGWTVAINKDNFVGKDALLEQQSAGVTKKLVGLQAERGPVPRHGCPLLKDNKTVGEVTSGTFSPALKRPIGMAYVSVELAKPGTQLTIEVRNQKYAVEVVPLPFWKLKTATLESKAS